MKLISRVPAEEELRKGRTTLFSVEEKAGGGRSSIFCMRKSLILYCINMLECCPPAEDLCSAPLRVPLPKPSFRRRPPLRLPVSRRKRAGVRTWPPASPRGAERPNSTFTAHRKGTYPQGAFACVTYFFLVYFQIGNKGFPPSFCTILFSLTPGLEELRNAVPHKTLRHYILTSSVEALPKTASSLLSCFTNAESPKAAPIPAERLMVNGESLELCSEAALQSWFDPLELALDQETKTLTVRFPHAFFGIRFSGLFQAFFEKKARALWGRDLTVLYSTVKTAPVPSVLFAPPSGTEERHGVHPAVGNPTPFGEEWTFETFIGNGKHKWALSLARDVTRRAVYRAAHGRAPSPEEAPEAPGLLVLCGPHGTGKTHLLRAVGNELFRTLGGDLYSASLSDLEMLYAERSVPAARQELFAKEAILLDDFQHLLRVPDMPSPRLRPAEAPSGHFLREELCLLLDRFLDQGKAVVVAGVGRPKDWALGRALLSRLETGLWAELPEPDLDVRLRYAQQQTKIRRLLLPREHLLLLAQHCPDIRRLSGVIRRAASHRSLLGRDLSEQDLLGIVRQGGDGSALTPQLIISIVGEHCGVAAKEILGEKRRPDLVQARQLAMYLCRELLGHSYPVIGRMFGGKDHSTVMHGVKKIKLLQERDRLAHSMVTELTKACLEHRG